MNLFVCVYVVFSLLTIIGVISLTTPEATLLISRYTNPLPVFRPLMSSPFLQSHDHLNLLQTVVAFKHEALVSSKLRPSGHKRKEKITIVYEFVVSCTKKALK